MNGVDVPLLGSLVLAATLVVAAYTFAMALAAGRGRPHLLASARTGAFATAAMVTFSICLLAYAFQTHDFRIRYIARYSDRSMPWWYLLTSLWGGQDGSLLWWSFLLSGWTVACLLWFRGRFRELEPWVIATLMSILGFFLIVMLFAANPFAISPAAAPADGEGLNPLLQNYWMVIHPPMLYMGFVGWAVPFAFAIGGLVTGRLENEWIHAARPWVLLSWLFLSIGLTLGMVWSYEELGWGGYWAWDPVENASFMPWLAGTAFLHSVMVQERYGMLRVWNMFLICLTFFMTIFGTFLTRSGLIASVHSFARSDLGIYFVWYMAFLIVVCVALIVWRLPRLRARHELESLLSREFAFLLNNWILLGMMLFVLIATTFPLLSEWIRGQEVTVGPPFYNKWMVPFGVVLLFLAGVGPVISWRKATGKHIVRAFVKPTLFALGFGVLHLVFGKALGLPPTVASEEIYETLTGKLLSAVHAVSPLFSTITCAFVIGTVVQEFWRGAAVRVRTKGEGVIEAVVALTARAKRRYGGYIVHVGIAVMYIGFTGAAYDTEKESALRPGEVMSVGNYRLRYEGPKNAVDPNKRMLFAELSLLDEKGEVIGRSMPAKFVYRTHPEMPTTEVDIRSRLGEDLYVIMSTVDPESKLATFRVIVRPLVIWIWFGAVLLIFGTLTALAPSAKELLARGTAKAPPRKPLSSRGRGRHGAPIGRRHVCPGGLRSRAERQLVVAARR
jgi:cytochrome c-type biogenesis protein CcmF